VDILRELHPLTGRERFVFPGARSNGRPMCDKAILAALRRMGIGKEEMSGHGFRAVATLAKKDEDTVPVRARPGTGNCLQVGSSRLRS
jgi:hypothetical protein